MFQLIDNFRNIRQAFDNMFSCIVFFDVSKAFVRVWHKGPLFKLRQNGIEGKLLEWLNSLSKSEKAESGFKNMFCWPKIYICRGASGISSWASFILGVINDIV